MKNLLAKTIVFIVFVSLINIPLMANGNEQEKGIEEILTLIRQEQGVTKNQDINPDKVSADLLEELGDAVLSYTHPNEREHEWMDQMMGGEGSESLKAMERVMGYRYLEGGNWNGTPFYGPGFEGRGYFGPGMMRRGWGMPMMGGTWGHPYWQGWGFNLGGIFFWLIGIGFIGTIITLLIIIFRRQKSLTTPIVVLKARLAKGEITKEEYEKLKQDILG